MTEDEAKTKWCPFARATFTVPPTINSPRENGYVGNRDCNNSVIPNVNCIASSCMAWRWLGYIGEEVLPPSATDGWKPTMRQLPREGDVHLGFCGLADR